MTGPVRTSFSMLAFAAFVSAGFPAPVAAQSDPITDRLIRELRGGASRGMRSDPYAVRPAEAPAPTRRDASVDEATAPSRFAPEPAAARPPVRVAATTTAPPGVPASSLTVLFETGSATLAPSAQVELVALGRALRSAELATSRFRIEGHTDRVGSEASNQLLSERRAATVRDYLVSQFGIAETRLTIAGMGETQTLVPTADETPHPRNRRVQVLNVGSVEN